MGKEPSRILSIRLQENSLNEIFTDKEFVKQFVGANKLDPFSDAALKGISEVSPSLRFIPKSSKSRANTVLKISLNVNLSPEVQKLCDRLRDEPSSFSFAEVCRNGDNPTVCSDEPKTVYVDHGFVTEKAQFYEVVDSLLCLYIHWCTLDFTGEERYLQISDRLRSLGVVVKPECLTDYCKEKALNGKKIESFCTNFLGDIGTIFNLPRQAKWFIMSIGVSKKNFQSIHQKLAERLIKAGIETAARNTKGGEILHQFRNLEHGAFSSTRSPSETRVSVTSPSSVTPSTISSQQVEASAEDASRDSATSEGMTTSNNSHIERVDDVLAAAALRERESTGRLIDAYDGHLIMPVEVPAEISVRHSAVGARKRTDVVLEDYGTSYVNGQSGANDSVLMAGTDSSFNHGQSQSERQAKKRRLDGICKGIDNNQNNIDRLVANLATILPPNSSQQSLATLGSVSIAHPYSLEDDQTLYVDNLQYPQGENQIVYTDNGHFLQKDYTLSMDNGQFLQEDCTLYMDDLQYPQGEGQTLYMDDLQYPQGEGQTLYMDNLQYPQGEGQTLYMDNLQYGHGACQPVFGTQEGPMIF